MKNVVWTKGTSGLEGEFQSASEVDFYVDKVHFLFFLLKVAFMREGYVCNNKRARHEMQ